MHRIYLEDVKYRKTHILTEKGADALRVKITSIAISLKE